MRINLPDIGREAAAAHSCTSFLNLFRPVFGHCKDEEGAMTIFTTSCSKSSCSKSSCSKPSCSKTSRLSCAGVVLSALLVSAGTAAMAAPAHSPAHAKVVHSAPVRHVAAARRHPVAQQETGFPDFFALLFGGAPPYGVAAHSAGKADAGEYVSQDPPIYEDNSPSPAEAAGWQAMQAAQAAVDQAARDEVDEINQMNATLAAVAAQQAVDDQNTLQAELNAGM
jgi:hypothetical protein